MKILDAKKVEEQDRRQKRVMIALFSICFVGLSYLVYDYIQIIDRTSLPENLNEVDGVVARWKAEGFVNSFDVSAAKLVVNENVWERRRREEKVGIITQLGRYCAEKNKSDMWALKVVGNNTSAVLGELGRTGLSIN